MTSVSRRRFLGLAAAVSIDRALAGTRLAHGAEEIRVGALCELTGPAAAHGKSLAAGMRIAADEINRGGGTPDGRPGIGGRPLALVVEDVESSPPRALFKAKKLVEQDRVAGLVGATAASVALAVQEYASTAARVPFLNAGSGNPSLSESPACDRYVFQSAPNLRTLAMASLPVATKRGPRWYFIGDDHPLPRLLVTLARTATERGGVPLQVAGEAYAHIATRDYAEHVTRAVEARPDVIGISVLGRGHARLLRELRQRAGGTHVHSIAWLPVTATSAAEVTVGMTAGEAWSFDNAATPRAVSFARAYRQVHGSWPDSFAARGYHAIAVLGLALRKAATTDAGALARTLETLVYEDSIYGAFRFRACDHVGVGSVLVVEGRWSDEQKFHPAYLEGAGSGEAMLPTCGEAKCGPWTWS
jgi:branched-chain amino acid transport system substrate-binding protein